MVVVAVVEKDGIVGVQEKDDENDDDNEAEKGLAVSSIHSHNRVSVDAIPNKSHHHHQRCCGCCCCGCDREWLLRLEVHEGGDRRGLPLPRVRSDRRDTHRLRGIHDGNMMIMIMDEID